MVDEMDQDGLDTVRLDQPKKKGKKGGILGPIIFGLVAVIALTGGVVSYLVWFAQPQAETSQEEEQPARNPASEKFDFTNLPGAIIFDEPFLIRLNKGEGQLRNDVYLKITVVLEVKDKETAEEIQKSEAVLSRMGDVVNTFFASKTQEQVEAIHWAGLKQELMEELNSCFPTAYRINKINFKSFITQPR